MNKLKESFHALRGTSDGCGDVVGGGSNANDVDFNGPDLLFKNTTTGTANTDSNEDKTLYTNLLTGKDVYDFTSTQSKRMGHRQVYCLYLLIRALKQRELVLENNAKIMEDSSFLEDDLCRDQGFTRPRTLVILPTRHHAYIVCNIIKRLLKGMNHSSTSNGNSGYQIENQKKFIEDFAPQEGDRIEQQLKEDSFIHAGNTDDCFRLGIKITRKTIKFFVDFYEADIIICSPLGMKFIIDGQVEHVFNGARKKKKKISKKGDSDFLSSLDLLIVDGLDHIMMQNLEHLQHLISSCNGIPVKPHASTDYSRILPLYLDGKGAQKRQNVVFSSLLTAEMNTFLRGSLSLNVSGFIRVEEEGPFDGVMRDVFIKKSLTTSPQFHLIKNCSSVKESVCERRKYFIETFYDLLSSGNAKTGTLIFMSSYFDFVQLKEVFEEKGIKFACLSEYSSSQDISRSRTAFFNGTVSCLLVTERFHFYRQYQLRGCKRLIFYHLPDRVAYFEDFVSYLVLGASEETKKKNDDIGDMDYKQIDILYSEYDSMKIERIVGSAGAEKLF